MKQFSSKDLQKIGMSLKEFEVLEDVLSEITEYREYEGFDNEALNNLQTYFSYSNYQIYES